MVARRPRVPDRGDVVWITLTPQAGAKQAGRRPAVVLSPAAYKEYKRGDRRLRGAFLAKLLTSLTPQWRNITIKYAEIVGPVDLIGANVHMDVMLFLEGR